MNFTIHTNVDYGAVTIMGSQVTLDKIAEEDYTKDGFLQKNHNAITITGMPRGMAHMQINFNIVDFPNVFADCYVIDTGGYLIVEDWNGTQYARIPCSQRVSIRATQNPPLSNIFDIWIGFEK